MEQPSYPIPKSFFSRPFLRRLILSNEYSEARDIAAAERNYLSWLKVSLYLSIAGAAILINLRFPEHSTKSHTYNLDQTIESFSLTVENPSSNSNDSNYHIFTLPLGFLYYGLALISVLFSLYNYISTVNGYIKKRISVSNAYLNSVIIALIAVTILLTNIYVLFKIY